MSSRLGIVAVGFTAFTLLSGFHGSCGSDPAKEAERTQRYVNERIDDQLDDLKATPDQRTQIHALADGLFPQVMKARADGKAAHTEALAQLDSAQPDATRLHAIVDERVDAFRALGHQIVDAVVKAHQVLNPDQRKAVLEQVRKHLE